MPETMDVSKVIPGWQGELYYEGLFLAEVEQFEIKLIPENVELHPIGQPMKKTAITGYSCELSFTQIVVKNDMLKTILQNIKIGSVGLDFMGKINNTNNNDTVNLRKCVPKGDIVLMSAQVNDVMKNQFTFGVNEFPDLF